MVAEIKVPTLGESVNEAKVIKWLKKPGDIVIAGETVMELETDKITLEVPTPTAGQLKEILIKDGSTVQVGDLLGTIEDSTVKNEEINIDKTESKGDAVNNESLENIFNFNQELSKEDQKNIDKDDLSGVDKLLKSAEKLEQKYFESPEKNVRKEDVLKLNSEDIIPNQDQEDLKEQFSNLRIEKSVGDNVTTYKAGEKRVPMTKLRQTIAKRLKEAQNNAAILTTFNEVDMTELMAVREEYKEVFYGKHGVKLGITSFFVKACVGALKQMPLINAETENEHIIYKNYFNIGVAVGSDKGLVVPVIKNADKENIADIEKIINIYAEKVKNGTLKIDDMQNGTFTISNGGVYGSLLSTPILNPPQSAILGMHKIQSRAVIVNDDVQVRSMMYLALSYDHRIIDGKEAVIFLGKIKDYIEDPRKLLLNI